MRGVVLKALLSHWRRRPLQLFSLAFGLALATALWTGVQAINAQARQSYAEAARSLGQIGFDQIIAPGGVLFDQSIYVALRRAGWQVSPVLQGQLRVNGPQSVDVIGMDPLSMPSPVTSSAMEGGAGLLTFITPPGQAMAHPETVAALQGAEGLPELLPVDGVPPGQLMVDIGVAQHLLDAPGQVSRLIVLDEQPLARAALHEVAPELQLRTGQDTSDIARLTDSFHLNLTAFGLLSAGVGLFIVHAAIGLAFEQRRVMFRTLRALGVSLNALTLALVAELLVFAIVTGAIGVVLGYVIAALLLPDVAATLRGLYGAGVSGTLSLQPAWWLGGLGVAMLGTAISASQSLWRLWRMGILAPARPRAWARQSQRGLWRQLAVSLVLGVLAVALARWGQGLVAGFAMLGALLMGAALALPPVLSGLAALAARASRGALAGWFWADTRHQMPGISLALMALLLAVAANIGVSTMVGSFRAAFTGWLDQVMVSELYVQARDEAEAEALDDWFETRADAVLPIWSDRVELSGLPGEVYGIVDHSTYRDNRVLLSGREDAWDRVFAEQGALISEQLSYGADLSVGDVLSLPGGLGLSVVGIYADYGNPMPQALIAQPVFNRVANAPQRLRLAVRVAPEKVGNLMRETVEDFGLPGENMTDQASIKAVSIRVFEQTFAITAVLNVLTLGVAGFAILTSLLTLSGMRLAQLAPVWAIGLSRSRLSVLELGRAALLTVVTAIVALPVGLLLAWALLAVVNVVAFGWRIPMQLFPVDWAVLGVVTMVAGVLSAAWPALRLARIAPAELLKVFAHER
ncbi:ABC transporter permease [Actibacterium mucosum KCTC 23349]|uniref:ABC transporter permease n=1 Tax=Actibacterium mucosum KCTC 23349 TaxID=1454373 RepID=A0A037ZFN5_9RHOB|nr:FtsX-like permease family protein [Actibacterium mucosum]KAJ54928.1 ABC transporter permease [Actibacterium mucosum KCTC 23349]